MNNTTSIVSKINNWLFDPVSNTGLGLFRVVFGLLAAAEGFGAIATGWVNRVFIEPAFTFNFIGLDWLQPLPGGGMIAWFILLGISGLMICFGLKYRLGVFIYAILWSGAYYMQKSSYNNHYYLMVIMMWMMLFIPANKSFSLDAKIKGKDEYYTPRWTYVILIGLLLIVYTYASLNKIYPDWLQGKPINLWFSGKRSLAVIGDLINLPHVDIIFSYGGIIYDLLVIPALLWKPTRKWAFFISLFFHLFNSYVFQIGIFPYLMIGSSFLFFEAKSLDKLTKRIPPLKIPKFNPKPITSFIVLGFLFIMILLPLRRYMYDSNVNWSEEGHRLSWRMMLRSKSGFISFKVIHPDGKEEKIRVRDHVSSKQYRSVATKPDCTWQFVQYLKNKYDHKVEIYASSEVGLNGRKRSNFIDPDYNLYNAKWKRFKESDWILPFPGYDSE